MRKISIKTCALAFVFAGALQVGCAEDSDNSNETAGFLNPAGDTGDEAAGAGEWTSVRHILACERLGEFRLPPPAPENTEQPAAGDESAPGTELPTPGAGNENAGNENAGNENAGHESNAPARDEDAFCEMGRRVLVIQNDGSYELQGQTGQLTEEELNLLNETIQGMTPQNGSYPLSPSCWTDRSIQDEQRIEVTLGSGQVFPVMAFDDRSDRLCFLGSRERAMELHRLFDQTFQSVRTGDTPDENNEDAELPEMPVSRTAVR